MSRACESSRASSSGVVTVGGRALLALCALGCAREADPTGVAAGLRALAAERQVELSVHGCARVGDSRVVICEAEFSASELAGLRGALVLGPLGKTKAPGPAFGKSRCLDQAPAGALALVSGFPWLPRSHYRYLLMVVPESGGHACVETEEGYG